MARFETETLSGKENLKHLIDLSGKWIDQGRVRELAGKCNERTPSTEERAEYKVYVMAANVGTIRQAKARARRRALS